MTWISHKPDGSKSLDSRGHPSSDIQAPSELEDRDGLPAIGSISLGQRASIEVLSDDVLLTRLWLLPGVVSHGIGTRLVHVCQRWRLIVFASPRSLDLQLYCTPRTPVKKTLDYWPAFPITIRCGRSQHADTSCERLFPEDGDNVIAALQRHNRVRSIDLCLTYSVMEKLSTQVKEPLSELEVLVLRSISSRHFFPSNLPFRWSSRLRVLHLTDISLPSLPLLLSSSPNLVDLQLHRSSEFPPPAALANALSGMTRLESLSLLSDSFHRVGAPLPSGRRVILPALTRLDFRGFSQYLEGLVAEIDAPCLGKIEITFVGLVRGLSEIGQFVNLIEAQRSHSRAEIRTNMDDISIRFTPRPSELGSPSSPYFILRIHRTRLDHQLSSMDCVCNLLPPFLLGTGDLGIITRPPSSGQDDIDGENWLRLLRPFSRAEKFYVAGELATDIMHALQQVEGQFATVLPALRKLYVAMESGSHCALQAAVASFKTSRQLSGRPIEVEYSGTQLGTGQKIVEGWRS
ncbi:hypothetical protein EDB89DRAFT_1964266 [Lactarius sanguifluus]|nr:hypothetical protein EDB89DRAFT_1964266 [Lactarius sanguifluus]